MQLEVPIRELTVRSGVNNVIALSLSGPLKHHDVAVNIQAASCPHRRGAKKELSRFRLCAYSARFVTRIRYVSCHVTSSPDTSCFMQSINRDICGRRQAGKQMQN